MRWVLITLILGIGCWTGCDRSPGPGAGLSESASAAIVRATQAYSEAWLSNDSTRVMATLTADAVLLPSGMEPVSGEQAIRRFWWPADGPPTRIITMEQSIDDVSGDGDVAIVRGRGTLSFAMRLNGQDVTRSQRSTFLNVLRRQADGTWLIAQRIWSDTR